MEKIQDYFTIYKQSAWEKDTQSMIGLYDDNVVIFDMWEEGYQTGLAEWSFAIKDWLGSLGEEKVNVLFEMIEIHECDNVGFGSALITFQAISIDNTIIRSMKNRITLGFVKKRDLWKVVHQHTSAPINSDLEAILDF
ncbi:nuclear transport factor 2 family protein [Algoriphagus sp. D3-2-R+10]|uniref:nuclear transport factor 2 family protein n=1 Tax=Algoriphagus aurantiacus TaxID=3103948 RepID=UPI002B3913AA|nr:nuclear transport factor 2 family protein [Algoriphagus sp. D3-2-R+10]MEB2778337.1 nuclear transport factor 2 family protein [Algoriphagus sp. D3-2-R+10]